MYLNLHEVLTHGLTSNDQIRRCGKNFLEINFVNFSRPKNPSRLRVFTCHELDVRVLSKQIESEMISGKLFLILRMVIELTNI